MIRPMLLVFCVTVPALAAEPIPWTKEIVVYNGAETVVRFSAGLTKEYLIVRAIHKKDWHTYAIDNELRANEALAGKASLGVEQGLSLEVQGDLKFDGGWLQSAPKDLSKPELRWFTFGFEDRAYFVRKLTKDSARSAEVQVSGQACSGETCCRVQVVLPVGPDVETRAEQSESKGVTIESIMKHLVAVKEQTEGKSK